MLQHQDRDWLQKKYWDEGLSTRKIANLVGLTPTGIQYWMKKLGISYRTKSEAGRHKCSPEARQRMSEAQRGKEISLETRRKMSKAQKGPNNANWQGGRYRMAQGYIHVWQPDHPYANPRGYVREHRLVVERVLGRYLKPNEFVHHINGIRDDNRLENLQLINHHHRQPICPRCGWPMGNMEEYCDHQS